MSNNHDLHDERISRLYKLGGQSEPPDHLDREIKQAAHAEAPTRRHRYVWPSLATAAVLVFSISLVLKVLQHGPMNEAVKEAASTNGAAISPGAVLQESADNAVEHMEMEEEQQQRYRTITRKATPALAKPKKADAIELEAALATPEELKPQKTEPIECHEIILPDTASRDEWIRLYQKAVELDQAKAASCLQQAYQTRFNQALPMPKER